MSLLRDYEVLRELLMAVEMNRRGRKHRLDLRVYLSWDESESGRFCRVSLKQKKFLINISR